MLSDKEAFDMHQAIRSARIEGELLRSYQQGYDEGIKLTEEKFVPYLLENYTPEEISRDFDISMERILRIIYEKIEMYSLFD